MPITVLVRVAPGGLVCVNAAEASLLEGMVGQEVEARLYKAVNPKFRRKFFALLKVAFDMADFQVNGEPGNMEQFRGYVTVGAGYCEYYKHGDGFIAVPKSIAWAKMDDLVFANLYRDAMQFICGKWVLDEDQINQIVGFM